MTRKAEANELALDPAILAALTTQADPLSGRYPKLGCVPLSTSAISLEPCIPTTRGNSP